MSYSFINNTVFQGFAIPTSSANIQRVAPSVLISPTFFHAESVSLKPDTNRSYSILKVASQGVFINGNVPLKGARFENTGQGLIRFSTSLFIESNANPVMPMKGITCLSLPAEALGPKKSVEPSKQTASWVGVAQGAASAIAVALTCTPITVARTQILAGNSKLNPVDLASQSVKIMAVKMPSKAASGAAFMAILPSSLGGVSEVVEAPIPAKIIATALAGALPCLLTAPVDTITEQMVKSGKSNFVQTLKSRVKKEGCLSLLRGSSTVIAGTAAQRMFQYPGAQYIKEKIEEGSTSVTPRQSVANAVVAGGVVSAVIAPITHAVHLVAAEQRSQSKGLENPPRGMLATAKGIVQTARQQVGLKKLIPHLARGLVQTCAISVVGGAVAIATMEAVNQVTKE